MIDNLKIQPYLWHILVNLADKSQWRRRVQKEKVDVVFPNYDGFRRNI